VAKASTSRRALLATSSSPSTSVTSSAKLSPSSRHSESRSRSTDSSRAVTAFRMRSLAFCATEVCVRCSRSTATFITANGRPSCCDAAIAVATRSRNSTRLGRPVSASKCA
jgi:hypothetical protein